MTTNIEPLTLPDRRAMHAINEEAATETRARTKQDVVWAVLNEMLEES